MCCVYSHLLPHRYFHQHIQALLKLSGTYLCFTGMVSQFCKSINVMHHITKVKNKKHIILPLTDSFGKIGSTYAVEWNEIPTLHLIQKWTANGSVIISPKGNTRQNCRQRLIEPIAQAAKAKITVFKKLLQCKGSTQQIGEAVDQVGNSISKLCDW